MTGVSTTQAAEHRVLFDADFAAKVETVARTVEQDMGAPLDDPDYNRNLIRRTAAVALYMNEGVVPWAHRIPAPIPRP